MYIFKYTYPRVDKLTHMTEYDSAIKYYIKSSDEVAVTRIA